MVTKAEKMREGQGFIAALDQSGGSTPKALRLYGIEEDRYASEEEMFDLIHGMRARIVAAPAFTGDHVIGAILFEQTMDRQFDGTPAAQYLWEERGVVPFLKIDKGLEDEAEGVQLMKPMPGLDDTLSRASSLGVFGTKERSVVKSANEAGILKVVAQQFEVGAQVLSHGMMPILEPEVDINAPDKAECEAILRDQILKHLEHLPEGQEVMLKLTIPAEDGFYTPLVEHPKVMRVVALSGGYARDDANARLARNPGMIASFSRALTEGLTDGMSDDAFNEAIGEAIRSIHAASIT
jgi:fructose-bisphosphate aldolase class I